VSTAILSTIIRIEPDVVAARQRARHLAALVGFDATDQTRIATAVSEIARNAFVYAGGGKVEFALEGELPPQLLMIRVSDHGPGISKLADVLEGRYRSETGMGVGIIGTRRLMDAFTIDSGPQGTTIVLKKMLPARAPMIGPAELRRLTDELAARRPSDAADELRQQNQELLRTLDELRGRQDELQRLNRELEDTNRGVVALYAELDERADHLRRADELKTRFLSNMTHEFRTPVNSILGLTSLLADRLRADPAQRDELFYIRKSAQQLSEIVDDLLDLAKVEAGKIEVRPAPFEVNALFGALRGMLRPLLVSQSLNLVFEDPLGVPPVWSDETKVSQILRNFISNGLKYTERGEVRVSASLTDDRTSVRFDVRDTGIGIPPEHLSRIFDEFVQIENPLQRHVKGTGLGLPLSKRLAELLEGRVEVQSTFGAGSTFSLILPLFHPDARRSIAAIEPGRIPVLVIEDSPEDLLLCERAFASSPFQVVPAPSIAAAEVALPVVRPRAILLDLRMHGQESWDLLARLKRDPATMDIPVIIVSSVDDRRKGLSLGADAYAVKPVTAAWLRATVASLTEQSGTLRVLTIDDEETALFIVREMLAGANYQVDQATTGADGLRQARTLRPDAILLDVNLPDMSGLEVYRALRADPATAGLPVVILTSQRVEPDAVSPDGRIQVLSKSQLTRDTLRSALRQAAASAA
jgi:signal transduction histidine kinase/DNA-binding response OmpR family regulator